MKPFPVVARRMLNFTLLSVVFLASCAGVGLAYRKSPHFMQTAIDESSAREERKFFVAYRARTPAGGEQVEVQPYYQLLKGPPPAFVSFKLEDGTVDVKLPAGEGSISVTSETSPAGTQTTTVHVVGDTPWSSVSVYEVRGDQVTPTRVGFGSLWIMLALLTAPLCAVFLARTPVRRLTGKLFADEPASS